ncbi:MAG: SH3 domain-containing protein [Clostridia bacterium]|nr:SH3 domain-containing protein [Clostridia bacterium]
MKKLIVFLVFMSIPFASYADVVYQNDPYSEYKHVSYEPYDFFQAYHNPSNYKGTLVAFEGLAALSYNIDEETSILYVNTSRDSDKSVMLILNAGSDILDEFSPGDVVSVKGMAAGDSTELGMEYKTPIVMPFTADIISYSPLSPKYSPEFVAVGYASKGVNLRSAPDSSSEKVGYLRKGEKVSVLKLDYVKNWHQISYDGIICFVSAKYIDIE